MGNMGIGEKIVKVGAILTDIGVRLSCLWVRTLSAGMRGTMVWLAARVMSDPSCRRPY